MVGGGGVVNVVNNLCQARHEEWKHVQHDVCIVVLLSGLHIRAGFSSMILRSLPLPPYPPPLYTYIYRKFSTAKPVGFSLSDTSVFASGTASALEPTSPPLRSASQTPDISLLQIF